MNAQKNLYGMIASSVVEVCAVKGQIFFFNKSENYLIVPFLEWQDADIGEKHLLWGRCLIQKDKWDTYKM